MSEYDPEKDPWYGTKVAANDLVSAILAVPTRILMKGTGSRVLIIAGSILSSFLIAIQSGLEGYALIAATLAPVIGGGTFVVAKTKQHTDEVKAASQEKVVAISTTGSADAATTSTAKTAVAKKVTPVNVAWKEPFNVLTEKFIEGDPYRSWENAQDWLLMDLTDYKEEIRRSWMYQLYAEIFRRLDLAWDDGFYKAGATENPRTPVRKDFESKDLTEKAEKEFGKLIPSTCPRLGYQVYNIQNLILGYIKMYELSDSMELLRDKTIDWKKVNTLNDIKRLGLAAV